ncbi:hypothetical protein [Chryseobacterium salviniae]|uniref:Uncharacterized protein n=1 Tax=Chryseobacterium salviniae TaxID=3101750 RepID=A0ABU6HN53_9FLAO|nr:hypothetical protein [Chryseobacterium sp. T9W2-O]MEC3874491.1 hypothetical protein [Chryseobacterium sp. T9W2-O]
MKNSLKSILILLGITFSVSMYSQKRTEDFSISFPDKKLEKSYYNNIKLIDARIDSTSLGIVQKGAFNTKAKVVPTTNLNDQFQNLLNHINGENTDNGTIVMYLKQLYFAEITGAFSEHGYCYFQAYLFARNENGTYSYLDKIDSVIDHSSMDVTKATMKKGSEMVSDFISSNISKKPTQTDQYSLNDIKNFDEIEKQKLSLYNSAELKEGIYPDYNSFKNLQPSERVISNVKFYGKTNKIIKLYETIEGKEKEIKKNDVFAIVYQGSPYIYLPVENALVKAEKKDGDFYFTGKIKSTAKTGDVVLASAFFGIIGGLIASESTSVPFEQKLDYINGGFIPIKEVK